MTLPSRAVVRFYNMRGTAEQWSKEVKRVRKMARLSCHRFRSSEVNLCYDLARQGESVRPLNGVFDSGYRVIHAADLPTFRKQLAEQAKEVTKLDGQIQSTAAEEPSAMRGGPYLALNCTDLSGLAAHVASAEQRERDTTSRGEPLCL